VIAGAGTAVAIGAVGTGLIIVVLDPSYVHAIGPLCIGLLGALAFCVPQAVSPFIIAVLDRPMVSVAIPFATLIVNVLLLLLLAPPLGAVGAALASSSAYSVAALLSLRAFHRHSSPEAVVPAT
jgi:O-antigen/teichoic acid export membrane protein